MTAAVSEHPPFVHKKSYVPAALNPVMVVVGELADVIVAVPGLPLQALHVPVPVAFIKALPPGRVTHVRVWSDPAFGLPDTITEAVSVQLPLVRIKLYVPTALNPVIVVVVDVGEVIVAVPGLPVCAIHTPVPVPAIVAVLFVG